MKSWRLRARGVALTFCISSLLAATGQASAADLYVRPGLKDGPIIDVPPAWEGLYVGGHARIRRDARKALLRIAPAGAACK